VLYLSSYEVGCISSKISLLICGLHSIERARKYELLVVIRLSAKEFGFVSLATSVVGFLIRTCITALNERNEQENFWPVFMFDMA